MFLINNISQVFLLLIAVNFIFILFNFQDKSMTIILMWDIFRIKIYSGHRCLMIIFIISKFVYKIRVKECERQRKNQKILLFNIKCEGCCCLFLLKQWLNWTLRQTYQGKKLSQKGRKKSSDKIISFHVKNRATESSV